MTISSVYEKKTVPAWLKYLLPLTLMFLLWMAANLGARFREPPGFDWYAWIWVGITLFLIWKGAELVSTRLDTRLPWSGNLTSRVLAQVGLVMLVGVLVLDITYVLLNWVENQWAGKHNPLEALHLLSASLIGLMVSALVSGLQIGFQLGDNKRQADVKAERLRAESIRAHLKSLKQQIDPHFLFNNFSTLHGLIFEDQEKAGDYLLKLSEVYRVVLSVMDYEKITLTQELELLRPYTHLLQIRYGDRLQIRESIASDTQSMYLPPMVLQLLVENAIKHNVIDNKRPLTIDIQARAGHIKVANKLQPKSSTSKSEGLGLKNMTLRVRYLTGKNPDISRSAGQYIVTLPLTDK